MNAQYIERLRARGKLKEWEPALTELHTQVNELKQYGVHIPQPDEAPGWPHHYVCPKCQVKLTFSLASPHEHRCPVCKGTFHSQEMNKTWVTLLNSWQIKTAQAASILSIRRKKQRIRRPSKRICYGICSTVR